METTYLLIFSFLATVDLHSCHKGRQQLQLRQNQWNYIEENVRKVRFLDFFKFSKQKLVPDCTKPIDTKFIVASIPEEPVTNLEKGMYLSFDLDSIPNENLLMRSELNLFQSTFRNIYVGDMGNFKITVMEKVPTWFHPEKMHSLAFLRVCHKYNGWRNFNITKSMKKWIHEKRKQVNLTIVTQGSSGEYIFPEHVGIYSACPENEEYIPFISVFSWHPVNRGKA